MTGEALYIKLILPRLQEAKGKWYRPIKYSLFPPLGLATLASFARPEDEVELVDEHVEELNLDDTPDLVGIQVYITNANRAYRIADLYRSRGIPVVLGGLHVTSLPLEAQTHADAIVEGPGEWVFGRLLDDFRRGCMASRYHNGERTLENMPFARRDLIQRRNYLLPNSIVVSRGCPHQCEFCYSRNFYAGGKSYYLADRSHVRKEIESLPGRHLFFLDDNLFGNPEWIKEIFADMKGMNRVFQGAATVSSLRDDSLLDRAAEAGLRSLFIGFESLNEESLKSSNKRQNRVEDYARMIGRLHERGIMVNASFVFGLDADGPDVFDRTVDWAIEQGIETATFHIATPYPGTPFYERMRSAGRILHNNWDLYDTRHAVIRHPRMSEQELEEGYWRAYRRFYSWRGIATGAWNQSTLHAAIRHFIYRTAWKKMDPLWAFLIKSKRLKFATPLLETALDF